MKSLSVALAAVMARRGNAPLALCVLCEWLDGTTVFGSSTHDRDLTIGGVIYKATTGFNPSEIPSNNDMAVDSNEVVGTLIAPHFTEEAVTTGRWNGCRIRLFVVNYEDLTQGEMKERRGWIGQVTLDGGIFKAELLGLLQHYQTTIGEVVSKACLNEFCGPIDANGKGCGLDIADFTDVGAVTDWDPVLLIVYSDDFDAFPDDEFNDGKITFDAQPWITFGIKLSRITEGALQLKNAPPFAITPGMAITVSRGCTKAHRFCIDERSNGARFRGFPHLQGTDKMVKIMRHT